MKKKALSLLLVGAMAATLFAGCGSSSSDSNSSSGGSTSSTESSSSSTSSDDSSSSDDSASTSIDWDSIDPGSGDITIWVASEIADLTQTEADQFMADKGYDYTVTVEAVGEGEAASNVITDVEGAADIYGFAMDQLGRLISAGAIQQVADDFVTWIDENHDEAGKAAGKATDGTTYAFPMTSDNTYFLYYDKSVISDPSTIESIVADCEAAGKNFYYNYTGWYFESFFMATGCTFDCQMDADGNYYDAVFDIASDAGRVALQEMIDLASSSCYVDANNASSAVDYAAIVDGTWDSSSIEAALGDNMGVAVLPSFTGSDGNTYTLKPWTSCKLIGIKPQTDSGKLKVCYELVQYLTDEQCSLDRFEQNGWGPSNIAAKESDEVQSDPVLSVVAEQGNWAVAQPNFPNDYWSTLESAGADAANGAIGDDLDGYLQTIQDQLYASCE